MRHPSLCSLLSARRRPACGFAFRHTDRCLSRVGCGSEPSKAGAGVVSRWPRHETPQFPASHDFEPGASELLNRQRWVGRPPEGI
jgi:hypothetical protein